VILDRFKQFFDLDVCYVLDTKGKASSCFEQVRFRTLLWDICLIFVRIFKTSLNGKYADYLAVGIISRDRGYYSSAPIFIDGKVVGVVVVKKAILRLNRL